MNLCDNGTGRVNQEPAAEDTRDVLPEASRCVHAVNIAWSAHKAAQRSLSRCKREDAIKEARAHMTEADHVYRAASEVRDRSVERSGGDRRIDTNDPLRKALIVVRHLIRSDGEIPPGLDFKNGRGKIVLMDRGVRIALKDFTEARLAAARAAKTRADGVNSMNTDEASRPVPVDTSLDRVKLPRDREERKAAETHAARARRCAETVNDYAHALTFLEWATRYGYVKINSMVDAAQLANQYADRGSDTIDPAADALISTLVKES